ncbi:hypothetical protein PtrCC142_004009, partial [Pyrenophora tritici-repentis]
HQYEARKLRSSVHHLSVQYELLKHENEGLKEALQHKKKHRKKGKALDLQQRQEYHGGSVFWSPRKLREARAREAVRERDETEEKLQKARSKKQREEARLQRQDELEERLVLVFPEMPPLLLKRWWNRPPACAYHFEARAKRILVDLIELPCRVTETINSQEVEVHDVGSLYPHPTRAGPACYSGLMLRYD